MSEQQPDSSHEEPAGAIDFTLPTSDGPNSTASFRSFCNGKPALVFYETLVGSNINGGFKTALGKLVEQDPSLATRFGLVPIADVAAAESVKEQVFPLIQAGVAQHKISMLLDWTGEVRQGLGFTADANLGLFDRWRRLRVRVCGMLEPSQYEQIIEAMLAMEGETSPEEGADLVLA